MRCVLWLLLIVSASSVSPDENTKEKSESSDEERSPTFELADNIYNQQRECEDIIAEAIVQVLDEKLCHKFPKPDERYFQCKKTLDEKKRDYIKTALLGFNYDVSTLFTMRLSYGRVVTLPVPAVENPLEGKNKGEFDVQEELCATNKICLNIVNKKFSNYDAEKDSKEESTKFSLCTALLNDIKLKYIHVKKLDVYELKKNQGLSVMCVDRAITFTLPQHMDDPEYYPASRDSSVTSDIITTPEYVENNKDSVKGSADYHNSYNKAKGELKSLTENKEKYEEITRFLNSERQFSSIKPREDVNNEKEETELSGRSISVESNPQKEQGVITERAQSENLSKVYSAPENEESDNNNPIGDVNTEPPSDNNTEPINMNVQSSDDEESIKTNNLIMKNVLKLPDSNNDKDLKLLTYRVNLSENGMGKVDSGQIRKAGSRQQTSDIFQGPHLTDYDYIYDDVVSKDMPQLFDKTIGNLYPLQWDEDIQRKNHRESLENNIIMMENDCKELLNFGQQLLQHKLLGSLFDFENQYNECIGKLDDLKKMYIDKHHIDAKFHKNIFPISLPSGLQKFVTLPTQFIKTLSRSSSEKNPGAGDVFKQGELYGNNYQDEISPFSNRKPFDHPAFMQNDEFLESLKQGSPTSDSSTLSKVASMLHMSGSHNDKKITE